jgi:hypothetical protein
MRGGVETKSVLQHLERRDIPRARPWNGNIKLTHKKSNQNDDMMDTFAHRRVGMMTFGNLKRDLVKHSLVLSF